MFIKPKSLTFAPIFGIKELTSFYGDQVDEMTNNLTRMMEPLVLVIVGGIVAFIALAIYVPIYNLSTVIK